MTLVVGMTPESVSTSPAQAGLEQAPRAFIGLLRGENFGKLQVQVGAAKGSVGG